MTKYLEMTGKTEEEALEKALEQLGLERDDVSVELMERAKSGFLGLGSSPARIRVSYESAEEEESTVAGEESTAPAECAPQAQEAAACTAAAPAAEESSAEAAPLSGEAAEKKARIEEFLTGLLSHLGSTAKPEVSMDEEGHYKVQLVGEHLGQLIGRRGETLDAIQQLTNYAVNHGAEHRVRIHVDAENYRAKREQTLQALARKVAGKVVRLRRNVTLEPMNAYERHVIHSALQEYPGVSTASIGTEPNRRVVVHYERPQGGGRGRYPRS